MKDKRCLDYRKAIKESEQQLLTLERRQTKALLRDRMRFLRLLKSGECTSQAQAGKLIGLGLRGAEKLWKKYSQGGVNALLSYPYQGRKEKISEAQKQQLKAELAKDQSQSLAQVGQYVEQQCGVHYTTPGIYYMLKRLKVKKKTGRPVYHDKDAKGERAFKKKLSHPKKALW
ncbi:winged helix-turn-helix domain-containing protein [Chitinophagaceae bacterium LB-8]|uniref:Winged helix-turn-helix domain-containing protein n=1 Tax=Paraflavisolibacter caeni TaxID=2982496 RepID=A0A9X2XSA4_9BACT|nr:winged helix-turn-helix domain-containing protein [Paraflavisolibacter caeni]MCU7547725.1 winged helix-turn-helix domain-containing protein [Paraflavisolibacter caeni]